MSDAISGAERSGGATAPTESILQEAQTIIFGARNASYGHPRDNFKDIARLWEGYLHKYGVILEPIDVANLMILMKVARISGNGYHRDSVTDIAGYAGTIERLQEAVDDDPGHRWLRREGSEAELADWERELLAPVTPNGGDVVSARVWNSLLEVPPNVRVVDSDGDGWHYASGGWHLNGGPYVYCDPKLFDGAAPFTEVLEGQQS